MRKLIITLAALLVTGLLSYFLASGFHSVLLVRPKPLTLYIDGKEVTHVENQEPSPNGVESLPATIEYKGVVYVPLHLIGKHTNKPVGWDAVSQTAWLGEQPAQQSHEAGQQLAAKGDAKIQPLPDQPSLPEADRSSAASSHQPQPTAMDKQAELQPQQEKQTTEEQVLPEELTLFGLKLGDSSEKVAALLGEPDRREPSALGYEWWIYNQDLDRYLQVGIGDNRVVDLYSNGAHARIGQVSIGTSYQSLSGKYPLRHIVKFRYSGAQIEITNQLRERPLVLQGSTPLIFYIDKHNENRVTAMRMIDQLPLLQGGFYETKWSYRGKGPDFDPPPRSIKQREAIDAAHERQILDLVNVIRHRHKLPLLKWHDKAADVARSHSSDMENYRFFDHVSATTGMDPFDRLKQAGISYRLAGENIAAGFLDAIEAHESWMNSPGHRKNVLEKEFSNLGVGVVADYFTQNFLTPR
ncbi:MAG: secretion protein [Brevibacillus sp.]|nr:secretion protein [Brevibacillus sp.]